MNRPNKKESFLSSRSQMFLSFVIAFLFLCAWSLSAFWEHVDTLQPSYQFGARLGAAGGEVILLILIWQKCFSVHIGVRKWALILGFFYASTLLSHSAALRGVGEAEIKQIETEQRLQQSLTQMSREQAASLSQTNTQTSAGLSQRERLANETRSKRAQAEVMKNAQEKLASEIATRTEKIKDTAIFPRWYLNGWMYGVIFIAGLFCLSITAWLSMNREDIDRNYDGTPDHLEQNEFPRHIEVSEKNGSSRN